MTTRTPFCASSCRSFEAYYAQCRATGTFPQIWVSSTGALGHLDTLADRLRFTDEPEIRRLGELWTYAGERSPVAGQQALISARALRAALRHRPAGGRGRASRLLLTWIEPPAVANLCRRRHRRGPPMGEKTDPGFDRDGCSRRSRTLTRRGERRRYAHSIMQAAFSSCLKVSFVRSTQRPNVRWLCFHGGDGSRTLRLMR